VSGLFPEEQPSLGFPQPLAEKYRPKSIGEFIGLEKQKKVLAAFAKRPVSCAWLLLGPSGLGKSTMAMALAEMSGRVVPCPGEFIPDKPEEQHKATHSGNGDSVGFKYGSGSKWDGKESLYCSWYA
jgi:hypothetical protein